MRKEHGGLQRSTAKMNLRGGTVLWAVAFAIVPVERVFNSFVWSWASVLIVLALAIGNSIAGRRVRPFGQRVWVTGFVLVAAAGFISGLNSHLLASATFASIFALEILLVPGVLAYYCRNNPRFLRVVIGAFLVSQTVSALIGILQRGGLTVLGQSQRGGRINGLSSHPNVLGIMAALALLVVVYMLLTRKERAVSALFFVGIPNLVALVLTGSLSSMLTLAAGLIVLMIGLRGQALLAVPFIFLIGAGGLGLAALAGINVSFVTELISDRVLNVTGQGSGGGIGSAEVRNRTYEYAWQYLATDPWMGVGMDGTNAGTYNGQTVVHSFLLRGWYQGGVLFLGFAILAVLLVIRVFWSSLRRREFVLPAAVLVAIATYGATSALFIQNQYWLPILLCFAALPATVTADKTGRATRPVTAVELRAQALKSRHNERSRS